MSSGKIYFHYIGGRAGNQGTFFLRAHADDLVFHIYDADPDCLDQIQSATALSRFTFTNEAVIIRGPSVGDHININYDPFTSSCYPANPDLADVYYRDPNSGDYLLREAFRTVRVHRGAALTLAEIAARRETSLDFLNMDTQGSELEILKGTGPLAASQLLGFTAEVEFEPLYQGQPLFSDVHTWARDQGFRLVRLEQHPDWHWHRAPLGWRGQGALFVSDALYLKAPARIAVDHPYPTASLAKATFIALILGQIDYAAECLSLLPDAVPSLTDGRPYQRLVAEAADLYRHGPKLFPPSFADLFSEEQSFARFGKDVSLDQLWQYDFPSIRQRYFEHVDKAMFLEQFPRLLAPVPTAFESLLARYEMKRAAAAVQVQRLEQAATLARLLGLEIGTDGSAPIDAAALKRQVG
ncbi:FkbM family methyltransferase [Azospirillum sp. B4]|uniref:FkbM family methyltransferase n=1 Tax=Azospirillum sp. B4 TaxID=95605 RepID=UPI000345F9E8|nr:FkbM family methyltransferase [Azospirillum sp. B4]